jgi:hypothetical protein
MDAIDRSIADRDGPDPLGGEGGKLALEEVTVVPASR